MLLATLCLGSGKESLKDLFQARKSIHDPQFHRLQVQAAPGQVQKDSLPEIASFPLSHHQGQNLKAFILFRHAQHCTKALQADMAVDSNPEVGSVEVKEFVALALKRALPPVFQLGSGPRHEAR